VNTGMYRINVLPTLAILFLLVGAALQHVQLAAAPAGYDLSWWTVDGGGNTWSTGGAYALGGASGQPDTGVLHGNNYTLIGGFWTGEITTPHRIYLPVILKS
jgi:hypothetical protein